MNPETRDIWLVVLLAVVALSSLVQAVLFMAAAAAARRASERLALLEVELREQLREGLARLQSIAEDVTTVANKAHTQVERVEHLLDLSTNGARKAVDAAGKALLPPLKLLALYKGVRRGIDIYRARRA